MAHSSTSIIVGSGLTPAKYQLPQTHTKSGPQSWLTGSPVTVINTEDYSMGKDIKSTAVFVGALTTIPSGNLPGRRAIAVFNSGPNTLFIGGDDVNVSNGWPVASGSSISLDLHAALNLYGASTGTHVRVLEVA